MSGIVGRLLVVVTLLVFANRVDARCANTATGGQATDGVDMPSSGQSVVCDTGAPNPSTTTITSVAGSTGVAIAVQPGASLSTTARAIGLNGNASNVLNQGVVRTSGLNAFGIATTRAGNTLTNAGSIVTTGQRAHGFSATGTNSTLVNSGTITASGAGANGIRSTETTTSTTITNSGSIAASGASSATPAPPLSASGVSLQAGTFVNSANGTVSSTQAFGVLGGEGDVTMRNAGTITGGNGTAVQLGNGNNIIEMSGGGLNGAVTTGAGNDQFIWNGGIVAGTISLAGGNDVATLRNLSDAQLAPTPRVDGGMGTDTVTFDNSSITGFARFVNWENVSLTNSTRLTLDSAGMTLGDAASRRGTLSIDTSSTLFGGNGANPTVQAFDPAQLVTVTNAGTIDLTNGAAVASNTLTIAGNYVGMGGIIRLNTVLGADNSPSDRLAISGAGATASGSTALTIFNANGGGAATTGNGIAVVQAVNGATTVPGSFALSGLVAAGAYEYLLFRGGAAGSNPEDYFLRSALIVPLNPGTPPPPQPVPSTPPPPQPIARTPPPPPQPIPLSPDAPPPPPGFQVVQLIRPEVAVHSIVPEITRNLGIAALGTFHERRGDQTLIDVAPATWGRAIGQQTNQQYVGGVRPDFSGTFAGFQAGQDFARFDTFDGVRNFIGAQVSYVRADGNVRGFVIGVEGAPAGVINVNATSLGGYWTMIGPSGWYIDSVAQGDFINGTPHSYRGVGANLSGANFTTSMEAGLPIQIGGHFAVEPQAQFIYQHLGIGGTQDAFSAITYAHPDVVTGRIGVRLKGLYGTGEQRWTPYLKADVWWRSSGVQDVSFASNTVSTLRGAGPEVEVGAGITGSITQAVSIYGEGSYLAATDNSIKTYKGNIGLRVVW